MPVACQTCGFHTLDRNKSYCQVAVRPILSVLLSWCHTLMPQLQENSALHSSAGSG